MAKAVKKTHTQEQVRDVRERRCAPPLRSAPPRPQAAVRGLWAEPPLPAPTLRPRCVAPPRHPWALWALVDLSAPPSSPHCTTGGALRPSSPPPPPLTPPLQKKMGLRAKNVIKVRA